MFFTRKTSMVQIEQKPQIKQSSVLSKKPEEPQPQNYFDMMEETLLQTIRSSSMALLDLYQRRKQQQPSMLPPTQAPLMLPPPTSTQAPRPMAMPKPMPKAPPPPVKSYTAPVPKTRLDEKQIERLASKILNEIDDLLDSGDSLANIIQQSLTWNSLISKVENQSMKALFSMVKEMCEEEPIDIIGLVVNEIMGLTKTQVQNPNMFISILDKSPTWTNLDATQKKANLKTIFTTFNSRKADFMRDVYPVGKPSGAMSTGTPTNKNDGGNKGQGVQQLGSPSKYSPVNNHGISNLDKSEAYGRTPANNMNNIHEVQNAPGSSRVIPQNSGFVNNASDKSKKVSDLRNAIMNLSNEEEDYEEEDYEGEDYEGEEYEDEENGDSGDEN
jgi:hypothetical protein